MAAGAGGGLRLPGRCRTGHGARAYGLVNFGLGAGTVVGGLLALRLRPRRMLRAGAIALMGFAAFPTSVGAGSGVPMMAAGAAVAGAGMSFWGVMWATSVQTQVPPRRTSSTASTPTTSRAPSP